MSSIIEFFVAPDDAIAAGTVQNRPKDTFPSATYGNFDVWSTLEEWESILLDRDLGELIDAGGPEIVGGDDGPVVLLVAPDVTKALAGADGRTLDVTADRWVELQSRDGDAVDDELARELVADVAALAVEAVRIEGALYCWVS